MAVWQNVTFQSKVLRLFFGQLWIKLGYFLFQHLVTLPPNSFSLCLQSTQIRTHSFHYSLNLSVCPTHFSYSQLIHIVSQSQPHTLCQYSTLMPHSHPSHTHTLTNPLSPTLTHSTSLSFLTKTQSILSTYFPNCHFQLCLLGFVSISICTHCRSLSLPHGSL